MKRIIPIICLTLLSSIFALPAAADTNREMTYSYQKLWNTLVRFLRVDNNFAIREKDREAGYILFEYKEGTKKLTSTFELVPTVREKREFIRARLRIADMPSYIEGMFLDKFEQKLKREYGNPPPAKRVDLTKTPSQVTSQSSDSTADGEETSEEPAGDEEKSSPEDS